MRTAYTVWSVATSAWLVCALTAAAQDAPPQIAALQEIDQITYRNCPFLDNDLTIVDTQKTAVPAASASNPSFATSFKVSGSCGGTSIVVSSTITVQPLAISLTASGAFATTAKLPILNFSPNVVVTVQTSVTVTSPYLATGSMQTGGDTQGLSSGGTCPGSSADNMKAPTFALTQTCTWTHNYQDPSIGKLVAPDSLLHVMLWLGPDTSRSSFWYFDVDLSPRYSVSAIGAVLSIDHAEVLQAIQSADGKGVPYISGKTALVRAFAKSSGGELHLEQSNADGLPQQSRAEATVGDRQDLGSSVNYLYHAPGLGLTVVDYSASTLYIVSAGLPLPQTVTGSVKINFQAQKNFPAFYVAYIGICFDGGTGEPDCPDASDMTEQEAGDSLFPFPDNTFQYVRVPLPDLVFPLKPHGQALTVLELDYTLSRLLYKYFVILRAISSISRSFLPGVNHLVGWIPNYTIDYNDGGSEEVLRYEDFDQVFRGPRQISWQPVSGRSQQGSELPHRLGHELGLEDEPPGPTGDIGFNRAANKLMPPGSLKLMDPTYAVGKWISVGEYNRVLARFPLAVPAIAEPSAQNVPGEYVVVTGVVQRDGSGAQIDPVYHITSSAAQDTSNPSGNHCLQFSNAGVGLGQYCFDLDVTPTGVAGMEQQMFGVVAPWPSGTTQLSLVRGGSTLQTLQAASQDPVVTILSPRPGDRWQGGNTVSWSVTGAASDAVYSLLYSSDGGTSWLPLATDLTGTLYSFDSSKILGGSQVYIRVMAASGLNSGTATVGPITVAQTPKIGATVAALDFGNTIPGQQASQSFSVSSSGSGPLTISGISSDNAAFTVTSRATAGPLMSGTSAGVTVTFVAAAAGNPQGTLTIQSNDPLTPSWTIPMSAAVFATDQPSLATSQTAIDLGTVPVGQTGEAVLPLANHGGVELDVASIGASDSQFTLATAAAPFAIAAGTAQDGIVRFTPAASGLQTANVTIASNDPTHASLTVKVQGTGSPVSSTSPQIKAGGVVNAASFQGALARGGLATLFGSNFTSLGATAQAATLPLPLSLLGVSIKLGGIPAPLLYLRAGQINFQVPVEVPAGPAAAAVVTVNGVASPAVIAKMADHALGVFMYARTATALDPVIVHGVSNQMVTPSDPAAPNETVVVYATGVGKLSYLPVTGRGSPADPLSMAVDTPTAALGGAPAVVGFAGLTPNLVGLMQLNIQLPGTIPVTSGNSLPLTIQFPGDAVVTVNLATKGNATTVPNLGLSSTSLAFGGVPAGQTKDLSLQVSNTGSAPLSGTASVAGGAFTLVSGNPIQVAAGGAPQTITVRYAPTAATSDTGTLTLSTNDPASPAGVSLSGNGVAVAAPAIKITPTTLDFGSLNANQTKDLLLQVNNNGNAALTVSGFSSSNARFTLVSPGVPFNVGQGSFQNATIRFSPTAGGAQSGTLTFTSNDPASPALIAVTGTAVATAAPAIKITPTMLDFGTVAANQTKDLLLQVSNNGNAALTVSGFSSSNARFTLVSPGVPFNVGQGSFQNATIRFSPTTTTAQSGTLRFTSNDPASPATVPVSGNSTGGSGGGCVTAPANQLTWITGDGNANDLAGANNGTVLGGTTFVTCEVGQAFHFDGSSGYVSLGDPANLRLTSGVTMEAWINPAAAPVAGALTAIVTKWGQVATNTSNSDAYGLWLQLVNGHVALFAAVHTAANEPGINGGVIPLNTWSHVAMTFDAASGVRAIYLNGVGVGNTTFPGAIVSTNRNVLIGREDSNLPRAFNGAIDEVGIYGRALTAAEIQTIATAGAEGKCK